jgi:hypothetical protein
MTAAVGCCQRTHENLRGISSWLLVLEAAADGCWNQPMEFERMIVLAKWNQPDDLESARCLHCDGISHCDGKSRWVLVAENTSQLVVEGGCHWKAASWMPLEGG